MRNKISYKNLRATALDDFWEDEYTESIYLWEGAKHNLTITKSDEVNIPVLEDIFYHKVDIERGNKFTLEVYHKYIK